MHHLLGTTEIAELLGVSRQRAHQLQQREDFPNPVARLASGPIYERSAVQKWARDTGRRPAEDDEG